jgi:hypothetical protein
MGTSQVQCTSPYSLPFAVILLHWFAVDTRFEQSVRTLSTEFRTLTPYGSQYGNSTDPLFWIQNGHSVLNSERTLSSEFRTDPLFWIQNGHSVLNSERTLSSEFRTDPLFWIQNGPSVRTWTRKILAEIYNDNTKKQILSQQKNDSFVMAARRHQRPYHKRPTCHEQGSLHEYKVYILERKRFRTILWRLSSSTRPHRPHRPQMNA